MFTIKEVIMTTINAKEKSKNESGKKFAKQIRSNGWVQPLFMVRKKTLFLFL